MTRVKLSELRSLQGRFPGLLDDFLLAGEVQGDAVAVSREDFEAINRRHFGEGTMLGTAVHSALAPFVKVLDKVIGTDLAGCSGCGSREVKMNAASVAEPGDAVPAGIPVGAPPGEPGKQ